MSEKTRSNYKSSCTKDCANRDKKCKECFKYKGKWTEYIKK